MTQPERHTCHDQKTATGPAWSCPRCNPPAAEPAAVSAAVAPPAQAALRQQLIAAIKTSPFKELRTVDYANGPLQITVNVDDLADAVLAVLPEPADRAAVLRAEADRIDATRADFPIAVRNGITWATAEMRRHAAECPECGTTGACNGGPCPLRRMADETATTETPHTCKSGASTYHCPTSGQTESDCHGGFTTCCDRPDLHQPAAGARQDGATP